MQCNRLNTYNNSLNVNRHPHTPPKPIRAYAVNPSTKIFQKKGNVVVFFYVYLIFHI